MAWTRTLGDLVSDVTDRCDVSGYTARHPLATVRRRVIESYQRLRDWMTSAGSKRWIMGPIAIDSTGANIEHLGYGCKMPLISTGLSTHTYERVHLVEAQVAGRWQELRPITLGEIRDYYSTLNTYSQPQAWTLEAGRAEATLSTIAPFALIIAPDFDPTTYPLRVFAVFDTDVTDADATALNLDAPGFEWIIWDAVIKICARDNDSTNTYQIAMQERAKQEQQIMRTIRQETRNVTQRRDVFHGMGRFRLSRRL